MSIFRRYRFLIIILGITAFITLWEPPRSAEFQEEELLDDIRQKQITVEILSELYPEGDEVKAFLSADAAKNGDFLQAREYLEEALASGIKTNEDIFYLYALTLVAMDAPESEIKQAVATWRYHYPFSNRPDPSDKQAMQKNYRSPAADHEQ